MPVLGLRCSQMLCEDDSRYPLCWCPLLVRFHRWWVVDFVWYDTWLVFIYKFGMPLWTMLIYSLLFFSISIAVCDLAVVFVVCFGGVVRAVLAEDAVFLFVAINRFLLQVDVAILIPYFLTLLPGLVLVSLRAQRAVFAVVLFVRMLGFTDLRTLGAGAGELVYDVESVSEGGCSPTGIGVGVGVGVVVDNHLNRCCVEMLRVGAVRLRGVGDFRTLLSCLCCVDGVLIVGEAVVCLGFGVNMFSGLVVCLFVWIVCASNVCAIWVCSSVSIIESFGLRLQLLALCFEW